MKYYRVIRGRYKGCDLIIYGKGSQIAVSKVKPHVGFWEIADGIAMHSDLNDVKSKYLYGYFVNINHYDLKPLEYINNIKSLLTSIIV